MGAIQSFTSLLPALTGTIGTIAGTVNTVQNLANPDRDQDLALDQLRQRQQLQQQQLAQETALEREKLALQAGQDEAERQSALRRAVARQRAKFGASGLGATPEGGSGEAVLLGLFEENDEERQKRTQLDNLRSASLDLEQSQARSLNLLQATQLAEKQSLNSLF